MEKVERKFENQMKKALERLEAELSLVTQKHEQMERLYKSEGYDFAFIQSQVLQGEISSYRFAIAQIKLAMTYMD